MTGVGTDSPHDLEEFVRDTRKRIVSLERRQGGGGGGGGGSTVLAPAFMTPTSVTGGTFDPQTGRITLTPGATAVQVNGVFTSQYRAYKILFGWYTGGANGLAMRLSVNGVVDQSANYEYSYVVNNGGAAAGGEANASTNWALAAYASVGHHGEITVMEPMTTEYTNNQKRYVAVTSSYGNSTGTFGGIIGARDTTAYDGFTILNSIAGPGVTAPSGSWVIVVPVPTSQVPSGGGGSGGGGHLVGDVWQLGDDSAPPAGTLPCDGRAVSRSTYAELFAKIGTEYGSGDGSTTFNLPLLNGVQVSNSSTSVSRIAVDGIFPTISASLDAVAPDYWDILYSLDLAGTANNELRARFRSGGADVTAPAYFHSRDGYSSTNLQGYVAGADYFEPAWGTVYNVTGTLRVARAGKARDWTNFEGTSAARGSAFTQGTVEVGGSLQQSSKLDGIAFYTAGGGYVIGTVAAIPAGGSLVPSVIAYTATGGAVVPVAVPNKGTTAERNATYPLPTNTTMQLTLHNQKVQWQNTETGWTEQYYAQPGLAGSNAPNLLAGYPAGWYPIAGSPLYISLKSTVNQALAAGSGQDLVYGATLGSFGFAGSSTQITPLVGGQYELSGSAVYAQAAGGYFDLRLYVGGGMQWVESGTVYPHAAGYSRAIIPTIIMPVAAGSAIKLTGTGSGAGNVTANTVALTARYVGPPLAP